MNVPWGDIATLALVQLEWAILVYFLIVNTFYGLQLTTAYREMRRNRLIARGETRWRVLSSPVAPSISVLAPAYNEEQTIAQSVRSLLSLSYPNLEVVVVNDGSRDATLTTLIHEFELVAIHTIYNRRIDTAPVRGLYRSVLHPHLIVVDKENGGKADALNAALNTATGQLVCAIDADTLIEADALHRMVRPFLLSRGVLAAGGTIRVANDRDVSSGRITRVRTPRHPLPGFQVVEYLRAFLFGRLGWNRLGGNLIISGAFGLFRRTAVLATGGYVHDTVGEDMELVIRLRRHGLETGGPHRIEFIPDPVAWTEVPATLRVLGRQRDRWHRGLAESVWRHRRLFANPRYRALGLFVFPTFVVLELMAPVVELIGLLGLVAGLIVGALDVPFAVLFFLVAYGYGLTLTMLTLMLDEYSFRPHRTIRDRALVVLWAVLENVGYRQLTVLWRLRGLVGFLRKRREWGAMERRGFAETEPALPRPAGEGSLH